MIELCLFSLDQWEIMIHLLWGKSFNVPHSTNRILQHIEKLSKSYSGDPHLDQTKLNGLLLLTNHGVLVNPQRRRICFRLIPDSPPRGGGVVFCQLVFPPGHHDHGQDCHHDHGHWSSSRLSSWSWSLVIVKIVIMIIRLGVTISNGDDDENEDDDDDDYANIMMTPPSLVPRRI